LKYFYLVTIFDDYYFCFVPLFHLKRFFSHQQGALKRQLKLLEDNNTSLLQANLALENDVKKTGNWKPQVDVFKKQISEYHTKLETETKRADKLEFETKKLLEQLEAVKVLKKLKDDKTRTIIPIVLRKDNIY